MGSLRHTLHLEAYKEVKEGVKPFGGKDVTEDGFDINITFPSLRQASSWAIAHGVMWAMNLFDDPRTPVVSFDSEIRVYIVGYDYAVKQFGRDDARSYPFGDSQ